MARSPFKFGQLLTEAIYNIRAHEAKRTKKTLGLIQDELGFALGRDGGSSIEYWRKGNIPAAVADVEQLAREVVKRRGLDRSRLKQFLDSAGYLDAPRLCEALFPTLRVEKLAPFIVGPPITHPRQFFGRDRELRRIFGLWQRFPLQNVAVIGRRRSGKTSLLHYIEHITRTEANQLRPGQRGDWLSQPERYRWVFVDFQNPRMCHQEELLRHILVTLELPVPNRCDLNHFVDVVSRELRTPAIILMDEISAGLAAPALDQQFWWGLRSLGSNYSGGNLGFLLAAPETPALVAEAYAKPSPFFNIFGHTLTLGPLSEAEARQLVASSPLPFEPAVVSWILTQSGRWPALLQMLCHTYLMVLEEGQSDSSWQAEGLRQIAPYRYLLE